MRRCITETKACRDLAGQTASLEILKGILGLRMFAQLAAVIECHVLHQPIERPMIRRTLHRSAVAWDLQSGTFGQFLHCLAEGEMVVRHQKADGGAVRAAAEAVVELLVGD
jgi:hypothetical protein